MATLRGDGVGGGGWDWWGTWQWPEGPLREFDPNDWEGDTVPRKWKVFCEARRAAAPRGWRLAKVQRMTHRGDRDDA
ncbi:MAG TPA: hypothetical protein VMU34_06395 [Mycobacterium sp.]|nr:hypothetical protein [Mycobacterium sp.]